MDTLRKQIETLRQLNEESEYVAGEFTTTINLLEDMEASHQKLLDEQVARIEGEVFLECREGRV